MGQLDKDFYEERKFSNGEIWDVSVDWDDPSDGSEGGYDSHGNFVVPQAMSELIVMRATVAHLVELCQKHGIDPTEGVEQ